MQASLQMNSGIVVMALWVFGGPVSFKPSATPWNTTFRLCDRKNAGFTASEFRDSSFGAWSFWWDVFDQAQGNAVGFQQACIIRVVNGRFEWGHAQHPHHRAKRTLLYEFGAIRKNRLLPPGDTRPCNWHVSPFLHRKAAVYVQSPITAFHLRAIRCGAEAHNDLQMAVRWA